MSVNTKDVTDALDKLRLGWVLTKTEITKQLGLSESFLRGHGPQLDAYKYLEGGRNYYGSKETVAKAKKVADLKAVEPEEVLVETVALDKQLRLQKSENKKLKETLGDQQLLADALKESVQAYPPLKPVPLVISKSGHKGETWAVFPNADDHIGEVITGDGTDSWGEYNYDICRKRKMSYLNNALQWLRDCRKAGWNIKHAWVPMLGDFTSGDIHHELTATAEFPAPVQSIKAGQLYAEFLHQLAAEFETVQVDVFAGNHDRITRKPQFKQRVENSWAYVTGKYIECAMAAHKNVTVNVSKTPSKLMYINDHGFLCSNGNGTKAWMGILFYGIERADSREDKRRMLAMLEDHKHVGYHYRLCGHWHTDAWLLNWIGIGTLRGTDEMDHALGRFSPPSQTSFLVHKRRGLFNMIRYRVDK